MIKKYLSIIALVLLCTSSFAKSLTHVKVELKWFHQFQFAGIYAAKEKGIYEKYGLDVEILERDPHSSPLQNVLADKVQFGISDSTIVKDYLEGQPVVVLAAIFQHSPLVLISLKEKKLVSPIELKGKKVMYQKGVDEAIIAAMFSEFYIDLSEFEFVPHTFQDDALINDDVDAMSAYITNQPYLYRKRNIPINIIDPSNYGIDFYGDLVFTSRDYFLNHTDTALNFRKATIEGWEYALNHPQEIIQIIKHTYGSKKSIKALEYEARQTKKMIAPSVINVGTLNKNRFKRIMSIYKKQENIKANIKIDNLIYTHYLKPFNYKNILIFAFGFILTFLLIIVVLIIFNRQLAKRVKQQHKKLILSDQKNKKFIKILDSYVMSIRILQNGDIIHSSKDFLSQTGYKEDSLMNMNFFDLTNKRQSKEVMSVNCCKF